MTGKLSGWTCLWIIVLMVSFCASTLAEPMVVGERVEFSPPNPRAGAQLNLIGYFRVENEPAIISLTFRVSGSGPAPSMMGPSLVLGRLEPGRHSARFAYTLPRDLPDRLCFDILWGTSPIIQGACLESGMHVVHAGSGLRASARSVPEVPGGLDLALMEARLNEYISSTGTGNRKPLDLKILNTGPAPAANVEWEVRLLRQEEIRTGSVGLVICRQTIPEIRAGESIEQRCRVDFGADGAYLLRAKVDPGNRIRENNESNNSKDEAVVIRRR